MIEVIEGDLFQSKAEALVCPVNCKGVMGRGLAKEFRRRFPGACASYELACRIGNVRLGRVYTVRHGIKIVPDGDGDRRKVVDCKQLVFFPTKDHWRDPSFLSDVYRGLDDLALEIPRKGIASIAVPALGCGLGKLRWEHVEELIRNLLGALDCRIEIYPPR